jgi:4-amino-4-deoxy-L-arabinose transferase-like glycosyltransferase
MRAWGLEFGSPYAYHPDESRFVMSGVQMIQTGDLNPGWFYQPSLYVYLVALVQAVFFLYGVGRGWFIQTTDVFRPDFHYMGVLPHPEQYWMTRWLTVLLAVATLVLVYHLARRLFGQGAAVWSILLLAISQLHVSSSHFITTDVPVTFLIILAAWYCLNVLERGQARDYILAGWLIGLACSTKYSAYPLVATLLGAFLGRWRSQQLAPARYLAYAGLAVGAGFLMGTPYALLDLPRFLNGVAYEIRHNMILGHPGYEGNSFRWYLGRLFGSSERWITLFSASALGVGLWQRERRLLWLAIFPIIYLIVMSRNLVRFERYLVPIIPFLCIMSGYLIASALAALRIKLSRPVPARPIFGFVAAILLLVSVTEPLVTTIQYDMRLASTDVRTLARAWVLANVPFQSSIIVESNGPPLQDKEYDITPVTMLADLDKTGVNLTPGQYVIIGSAMYARFPQDTEEGKAYARILSKLERLVSFKGPFVGEPDYVIEVYRVP